MQTIQRVGPYVHIVEARSPDNHLSIVKLGVNQSSFQQFIQWNLSFLVAEFYGIIQGGLVGAVHAFRGLNRPLMHADDMHADQHVIAYSWRPQFDYVWSHSRFNGDPTPRVPPKGTVFVVLVQELKEPEQYPDHGVVVGTIEHWSWIAEDPALAHAPIEWQERYGQKLWSRDI
jgi:hypothetical protein